MSTTRFRRRGAALVMTLTVMTLAVGLLAAMSVHLRHLHETHRADELRIVARAAADSAVAYLQAHRGEWATTMPAEPLALDVQALLPSGVTGSVTLSFETTQQGPTCRVTARVAKGAVEIADERQIALAR